MISVTKIIEVINANGRQGPKDLKSREVYNWVKRDIDISYEDYLSVLQANAIPADVCRALGAEFVIGIDLGAFSKPEEEKGRFSRLLGSALAYIQPVRYTKDQRERGYQNADYMLRPPLGAFRSTDISETAMEEMYTLGYEEAKRCMEEIKGAIQSFSKERSAKKLSKKNGG